MQRKRWVALGLIALVGLGGAVVMAQTGRQTRTETPTGRETDIGLSGFGAFTGATASLNNGDESQRATSSGGGMLEFRHIRNAFVGFEGTYSLQRANQVYNFTGAFPLIPVGTGPASPGAPVQTSVSAMTHELTGDWVVSSRLTKSLRFFALAGVGVRITVPTNSPSGSQTTTSSTPSYIYGFGADWEFLRHIGLRAQYRGDIHRMPAVASALVLPYSTSPVLPGAPTPLSSPSSFEHDAEPMIGLYYRF